MHPSSILRLDILLASCVVSQTYVVVSNTRGENAAIFASFFFFAAAAQQKHFQAAAAIHKTTNRISLCSA